MFSIETQGSTRSLIWSALPGSRSGRCLRTHIAVLAHHSILVEGAKQPMTRDLFFTLPVTLLGLAALSVTASAQPQNLFVSDVISGNIYRYSPSGVQSTFAVGLNQPGGLAFDSNRNLFVAASGSGQIFKYTPQGVRSTFASGLAFPVGLAFDGSGNLFAGDAGSSVFKFTPGGIESTFATGLNQPAGLTFDSSGNLYEA